MALAVNLLFDGETTQGVEAIWEALAAAGVSRDMLDLNYPPHVTLAVVEDEALAPQLRNALALGTGLTALPVLLGSLGRFDNTNICWLACDGGAALLQLHAAVCDTVPTEAIRPYYRPGLWTPHMTLQIEGDADAARRIVESRWPASRPALATRLEMASFVPVVRMGGVDLTISS